MKLTVAGAGPGNPALITQEVLQEIKNTDIVVGFERIADDLKTIRPDIIKIKKVNDILPITEQNNDVVILASGDPCFFGITEFLKTKGLKIDKVLTGISSMQYLMSKLQKQWQYVKFYSFHGRVPDFSELKKEKVFFILTDKTNTPDFISQKLKKIGIRGSIYVGYNLSYEDELIETYSIGDSIPIKSFLNTVLVESSIL